MIRGVSPPPRSEYVISGRFRLFQDIFRHPISTFRHPCSCAPRHILDIIRMRAHPSRGPARRRAIAASWRRSCRGRKPHIIQMLPPSLPAPRGPRPARHMGDMNHTHLTRSAIYFRACARHGGGAGSPRFSPRRAEIPSFHVIRLHDEGYRPRFDGPGTRSSGRMSRLGRWRARRPGLPSIDPQRTISVPSSSVRCMTRRWRRAS